MDWIRDLYAGGNISDFWATVVFIGILVASVAIISKVGERLIATLTHSILVVLKDSTDSLEWQSAWLTTQMTLYRLRSLDRQKLNEAVLRKAQAVAEDAAVDSFEARVVADALGRWVATEFGGMRSINKRNALLTEIDRIIRSARSTRAIEAAKDLPGMARSRSGVPSADSMETDSTEKSSNGSAPEYDVFLAYHTADKSYVEIIARLLRINGLNPWLDKEQIPPGRWFQDIIQQAIGQVKAAAVFIGPTGLGRWQSLELRSFVSQCVERGIPVIPVLLPGVTETPAQFPFLRELNWVKFETLDDVAALESLYWGITGDRLSQ